MKSRYLKFPVGNGARSRKHRREDHQPQHRLQHAREKLRRIVQQLAHVGFGHHHHLQHERQRPRRVTPGAVPCGEFLRHRGKLLLLPSHPSIDRARGQNEHVVQRGIGTRLRLQLRGRSQAMQCAPDAGSPPCRTARPLLPYRASSSESWCRTAAATRECAPTPSASPPDRGRWSAHPETARPAGAAWIARSPAAGSFRPNIVSRAFRPPRSGP